MAEDRDGPLSRWSRLKRESRERKEEGPGAGEAKPQVGDESGAATTPGGQASVDPSELPDIDSLTKDSDYTVFLREGVPEQLRAKALRKLWRSDPLLANLDGLNNYDENFRRPFLEAGKRAVRTLYRVGRGWADEAEPEDADAEVRQAAASEERPSTPTEAEMRDEPGEAERPADEASASTEVARPHSRPARPKGRARGRRWGGDPPDDGATGAG